MTQSMLRIGSDSEAEALTTEQLLVSLQQHGSHFLRARAAAELSRRYEETETIYSVLLEAVAVPSNREARVIGITTVSWIAAIAILENGTPAQIEQVSELLRGWDETEKEDLKYYLRHTGLKLNF